MRAKSPNITKARDTISLRLENDLLSHLRKQSNESSDSINSTVNKILKLYYSWYLPAQKAGLRFVHKDILNSIAEHLTVDQIAKIARETGVHAFKSVIEMAGKEYSFDCIIDFIKTWLQVTALPYWHEETPAKVTYVIEHGMSRKWALFLEKILENVFDQINLGSYDVRSSESTIRIVIYLNEKEPVQKRTKRVK